ALLKEPGSYLDFHFRPEDILTLLGCDVLTQRISRFKITIVLSEYTQFTDNWDAYYAIIYAGKTIASGSFEYPEVVTVVAEFNYHHNSGPIRVQSIGGGYQGAGASFYVKDACFEAVYCSSFSSSSSSCTYQECTDEQLYFRSEDSQYKYYYFRPDNCYYLFSVGQELYFKDDAYTCGLFTITSIESNLINVRIPKPYPLEGTLTGTMCLTPTCSPSSSSSSFSSNSSSSSSETVCECYYGLFHFKFRDPTYSHFYLDKDADCLDAQHWGHPHLVYVTFPGIIETLAQMSHYVYEGESRWNLDIPIEWGYDHYGFVCVNSYWSSSSSSSSSSSYTWEECQHTSIKASSGVTNPSYAIDENISTFALVPAFSTLDINLRESDLSSLGCDCNEPIVRIRVRIRHTGDVYKLWHPTLGTVATGNISGDTIVEFDYPVCDGTSYLRYSNDSALIDNELYDICFELVACSSSSSSSSSSCTTNCHFREISECNGNTLTLTGENCILENGTYWFNGTTGSYTLLPDGRITIDPSICASPGIQIALNCPGLPEYGNNCCEGLVTDVSAGSVTFETTGCFNYSDLYNVGDKLETSNGRYLEVNSVTDTTLICCYGNLTVPYFTLGETYSFCIAPPRSKHCCVKYEAVFTRNTGQWSRSLTETGCTSVEDECYQAPYNDDQWVFLLQDGNLCFYEKYDYKQLDTCDELCNCNCNNYFPTSPLIAFGCTPYTSTLNINVSGCVDDDLEIIVGGSVIFDGNRLSNCSVINCSKQHIASDTFVSIVYRQNALHRAELHNVRISWGGTTIQHDYNMVCFNCTVAPTSSVVVTGTVGTLLTWNFRSITCGTVGCPS
ncbi:MAG: hypothetical protein B7C24_11980, partial [Bacteroidetes bacterium 4572_77]